MPDMLTFSTYFAQNPGVIWVVIAVALIIVEVTAPGIGGLFSAVAALSVGALMILEIIDPDSFVEELVYFFGLTIFWAVILWKPLKKMMQSPDGEFSDIIGTRAKVVEGDLHKDSVGKVKWSGVNMHAQVHECCDKKTIKDGEQVWIVDKDGMTLLIDTVKDRAKMEADAAKEETV